MEIVLIVAAVLFGVLMSIVNVRNVIRIGQSPKENQ